MGSTTRLIALAIAFFFWSFNCGLKMPRSGVIWTQVCLARVSRLAATEGATVVTAKSENSRMKKENSLWLTNVLYSS